MGTPIPCQCDLPSTDHAAGRCDHAATVVIERPGMTRRTAVCPDCVLTGDRQVRAL